MDNNNLQRGMRVICLDNESVEALVNKEQSYVVDEVSHRGALINLQGVPGTLAAKRFTALQTSPIPMELLNAGN